MLELPVAQLSQGWREKIQAVTAATEGLTYFKFHFLRRPHIAEVEGLDRKQCQLATDIQRDRRGRIVCFIHKHVNEITLCAQLAL